MFSQYNKASKRIPIHKAEGVTASERYLNSLCEKTFLSLWSYPGLYRDQKNKVGGDGKELCDMLVIFGNHILIFSDKHYSFPNTGNLKTDWKRWYRNSIEKSSKQAWGAERWLKDYPQRIYLNRKCTEPLPIDIPNPSFAIFHLIIVAHGCEDRCKSELGGSGSMMYKSSLGYHGGQNELNSIPFLVGDLNKNKTFIHILTETTLDILLGTLDTISDFTSYLEKKEKFIRRMETVSYAGEEELLALYLMDINDKGEHDFILDDEYNAFVLEEGYWEDFCKSPQRQEQIKQNEISYSWDNLIERFSIHALNATQYFTNHLELSGIEKGLRFMAQEPRTVRRMIVKNIFDMYKNTPDGMRRTKWSLPSSPNRPHYVFLALPQPKDMSYEEYREARGAFLEACVLVAKLKFPEAVDIVGIASEPIRPKNESSEDLIYLDAREWSIEMNEEAKRLQKDLSIFKTVNMYHSHENEYPDIETS